MRDNKVFLSFVQELPFINADYYFFLRLAAIINNQGDEITASPALGFKLIYYIDYISNVHCLYILTLVVLEIIIIVYIKGHFGFVQYYKIVSCFWYIRGLTKLLRAFIRYCP